MIYILIIAVYLIIGWFVVLKNSNPEKLTDILKDIFSSDYRPLIRIPLGIFASLIISPILFTIILLWPVAYLIRFFNKSFSKDKKGKSGPTEKEMYNWPINVEARKLKSIQAKYQGFNRELYRSEIIKRTDKISGELSKEFPTGVILYVAEESHPFLENYIRENLSDLKARFLNLHPKGYEFNFIIPDSSLFENNKNLDLEKKLNYNFPSLPQEEHKNIVESLYNASVYDFTKQLKKDLKIDFPLGPGFFRVKNGRKLKYTHFSFSYFELPQDSEITIDKAIWCYLANLGDAIEDVEFRAMNKNDIAKMEGSYEMSDFKFDYEAHKLSKEIKQSIESLKLLGHEDILMRSILSNLKGYDIRKVKEYSVNPKGKKLSKLTIDHDFKISLTDYNDLEIKMPALSKALFLLFLRHPEGIILKHISDHKPELLKIYQALSLRESYTEALESIEDLVNPLNNSVNEKASRIKSAFLKHFSEDIARYYHITGNRGDRKVISLERSFVNWKVKELDWHFLESKSTEQSEQEEKIISDKYSQALDLISKKDYSAAKSELSDIIEININHYDAYNLRAMCHFELLEYEKAENDDSTAIKLNPKTCLALHNRAEDRLMLGKYQEALEDITKYLKEVNNKCAESYYIRALIYFEQGLEKAKQDFVNAKKLGHKEAIEMLKQCKGKIPKKAVFEKKRN